MLIDSISKADKHKLSRMLEDWSGNYWRARIILAATKYESERQIASKTGLSRQTVRKWLKRYRDRGVDGLKDLPRPGRAKLSPLKEKQIVDATVNTCSPTGQSWTVRSLAKANRVSPATVGRIWKRFRIKPKIVANV
jgi:transposase